MRFPWGFDEEDDHCQKLKMELAQQIMVLHQRGVSQFLTACDCGVGLYAAEIVNSLRETTDQGLMLFCYIPHEEQATKWAPYLRERYFTMLEKCTHISAVCPVGAPDTQLQAYKKIIDLADVVLYVHDADMSATDSGENKTFAYAAESHTPTLVLHPKELTAYGGVFRRNLRVHLLRCGVTLQLFHRGQRKRSLNRIAFYGTSPLCFCSSSLIRLYSNKE